MSSEWRNLHHLSHTRASRVSWVPHRYPGCQPAVILPKKVPEGFGCTGTHGCPSEPRSVQADSALACPTLLCPTLLCPNLPCPALPYLTQPQPTLPSPRGPWPLPQSVDRVPQVASSGETRNKKATIRGTTKKKRRQHRHHACTLVSLTCHGITLSGMCTIVFRYVRTSTHILAFGL